MADTAAMLIRFSECATLVQKLGVFETILEKCKNTWVSRPAIVSAQLECVLHRRIKPSTAPFDFFGPKLTTSQRLRGAKARKSDVNWWLGALDKSVSESRSQRLLLIASLFLLGATQTVVHCESSLAQIVDAMSEDEWEIFIGIISSPFHRETQRAKNKDDASLPKDEPALHSMRFGYLIARREPERFGQQVFLQFLKTYSGTSRPYLQFAQSWALNSAIVGKIEWSEALRIIRDTYSHGIESSELDSQLRHSPSILPAEIYSEILSNPQVYPVSLCDACESAASRNARRGIGAQ
jgi:hypothetical protein